MPTFTATPEPNNVPPRVRLDFDTGNTDVFASLEVRRNGDLIFSQPPVGSSVSVAYDYESPFTTSQEYTVTGTVLGTGVADWTETWASLASWTGDTADWSVAGGEASSDTAGASIVRSATGTVQQVDVTDPSQVRLELLNSSDVVVVSVQVDSKVTLVTSSGSSQAVGSGSYSLVASGGTVTVTGDVWTVSRAFSGTPTKVRLVALGPTGIETASWSTTGSPGNIAIDSAGDIYIVDQTSNLVRKYSSTGVAGITWSTTGNPRGIAVDSSGNVYVTDSTSKLVRKYNAAGTQTASWSTTGTPIGIAIDSANNVYVVDNTNKLIRKFTSAGVAGITWSTTGAPNNIAVDSSNNLYVVDNTNTLIRKYSSTGTPGITWSTTLASIGIAVDAAGDVYVPGYYSTLRKYSPTGAQITSWSTTGAGWGAVVDASGNVYVVDNTNKVVRKYGQFDTSIGQVIETPATTAVNYDDSDTSELLVDAAWLIHPGTPDLSTCIDVGRQRDDGLYVVTDSGSNRTRGRKADVFSPVGRPRDVVVTSGDRKVGDWSLVICAPRLQDRALIEAEVTDQTPLLLRVPPAFGWDLADGFYSVGDFTDQRTLDKGSKIRHVLTLPLTPVDAPLVAQDSQWTFGDVLATYSSFSEVQSTFDTLLDLLVGPQ